MVATRFALVVVLALAASGCRGRREMAGEGKPHGGRDGGSDGRSNAALAAVDDSRACGEAGATATRLPQRLNDGMQTIGDAPVRSGETVQIGGVQAKYDPSAWLGNRETGHRGEALHLTIDQAEAGDGMPWGAQETVGAGRTQRSFLGPYRIETVASGETPPAKIDVHVEKRACPDHAVVAPAAGPIWMWASTEAIRVFTVDLDAQRLQIMVDAGPGGPRIDLGAFGWDQVFRPVPGVVRTARADGRTITIEAVEPGRDTHFDGGEWKADGGSPRFSVRARVDDVAAIPAQPADVDAAPCGAAAASRTRMPAQLTAAPRAGAAIAIAAGQKRTIAGVELTAAAEEAPARGYGRKPEPYVSVWSPSLTPSSASFGPGFSSSSPVRAERTLFTFEPIGSDSPPASVRVRSFALACPRTLALPMPTAPTYVWLSTIGHGFVTFGPADRPSLTLQLSVATADASLLAETADAHDIRTLGPDLIGHVVTLDDLMIEISDVVIDRGGGGFPIAHVQVRVTAASTRSPPTGP